MLLVRYYQPFVNTLYKWQILIRKAHIPVSTIFYFHLNISLDFLGTLSCVFCSDTNEKNRMHIKTQTFQYFP